MDSVTVTKLSVIEVLEEVKRQVELQGEGSHSVDIQELNHIDSDLYIAVTKDNILVLGERGHSVKELLTVNRSTVLHLASQYGSIKCVQHILSLYESLLLMRNSTGETALHLAAREGHYEVVAALLDTAKSSLQKPESSQNISLSLIQLLIRTVDEELETALHVAVRYNHKNVVQLLLNEDRSHIYPGNKYAETPLYLASFGCHSDIVKLILETSESPTFCGPNGRTALHAALLDIKGRECVKVLLQKNKDLVKKADDYGWTAFHYAANNKLDAIVEDLVIADKYVGYLADDCHRKTALHVAAYQGHEHVMKELVKHYPDSWETVDRNGQNILHIAVEQDRKEVIKFILKQERKEINKLLIRRDNQGNTPLHLIAKLGCYVPELRNLKAECDWEVLNEKGQTPWDVLQNEQTNTSIGDHAIIRITRQLQAKPKRQYLPLQDVEKKDMSIKDPEERKKERQKEKQAEHEFVERTEKTINTHIIVATLITTVALTAGFAMPGGFDAEKGSRTPGSPVLLKSASFHAFIITDATALLFSISALFLYFWTILIKERSLKFAMILFLASTLLNLFSILAMMLAFITGTYAVLSYSPPLANTVCTISSLFFLFIFYVLYELWKKLY